MPIIAANTFHSIQSLVDMFFVGKLGPEAVAAVGMSGAVIMILITAFVGLNVATVAMISRAVGAGNENHASRVAGQGLLLTLITSVFIGAAGYFLSPFLLHILGAEANVAAIGTGYLHIIFPGIFFLCVLFMIGAIFQGAGDTVTPLVIGIVATVCNVILNPILIFGHFGFPEMGVRGSALATVIARMIAFAVGIIALRRGRVRVTWKDMLPDIRVMWTLITIGVPGALQMGMRTIMNLVLMAVVAKFGTIVVAAYTIGFRVRMLGIFSSFGFGSSAATMVGQNLGAERPERSRESALAATGMAVLFSSVLAVVCFIFAPQIISIFNDNPAVISTGAYFLRITAAGLVTASIGIVLSRAMSGAGDTVSPMIITLVSLWGFQIPAAVFFSGIKDIWGITIPFTDLFSGIAANSEHGIWYAMLAASVLQAVLTAAWFARGKWKLKSL